MKENNQMQYEPKMKNRFLVEFPEQFKIESWMVQKINKPKFTNSQWQDIKIEFVDAVAPSTSQALFKVIENEAPFVFNIKILDPTGIEVEEWVVHVKRILTVDFGELDYAITEVQRVSMTVRPHNCVLS